MSSHSDDILVPAHRSSIGDDSESAIQPLYVPTLYRSDSLHYRCDTESNSSLCLSVGYNGTIHLWHWRSTISIYVSEKGPEFYREPTMRALNTAIHEWNKSRPSVSDPRPYFQLVETKAEATCQIKIVGGPNEHNQGSSKCDVLAHSFFPGDEPIIKIYMAAFKPEHKPYLANVLNHELIHVQGVRHYYAPKEDKELNLRPSIVVGRADEFSISNYLYPLSQLQIRDSDVDALNELYSIGDKLNGLSVVYHHPMPLSSWSIRKNNQEA